MGLADGVAAAMNLASEWDALPGGKRPASSAQSATKDSAQQPSSLAAGVAKAMGLADEWDALPAGNSVNNNGAPIREVSGSRSDKLPALPDTTAGRAGAGALGELKGAFDTVIEGPAQLAAHTAADIYPAHWPGAEFLQNQKRIADEGAAAREKGFQEVTRDTKTSASIGHIAGDIGGALLLPQSKAAEGANLINRMIAAGKTGAIIGLAQPVKDAENYWKDKAIQTGVSAVGAALFQPVAEVAGKAIGTVANKAMEVGRRVMDWAGKGVKDEAVADVIKAASPDLKQAIESAVKSGKKINPEALGRQVEADSLPVKISLTSGQARQDPIAISQEMNLRSKNPAVVYKLQEQNNALIQNLNHLRDTGAPDAVAPDAITAGESLIQAGKGVIDKQREMTTALYKKLSDANGGNLPIDGIAFVDGAEQALKKQMKGAFLPPEIRGILEEVKTNQGAMTFENFENLRSILAAAGRTAERAGNGNTEAAISIVRNSLESTPVSSEVAGVKELADAARSSAKFGHDMLRNNPSLKAIDSGKAADNNFVQKYIIGASKKDITGLAQALQHDPVALQTIKAGTINYLKQAAGVASDNGNFTQAGYNKALQALGPKLEIIFGPEEAATLRTLGNVARYTQLAPKGSYVNSSNTDVANLARGGADMAASAIDSATGTPIGSMAKNAAARVLQHKASAAELGRVVDVGAGASNPSAANDYLSKRFPLSVAQKARIPISVLLSGAVSDTTGKGEKR